MIKATNLSLHQSGRTLLDAISFTIPAGRITAFVGSSGAGKTTLLRCCAHLITNYTGTLLLSNRPLADYTTQERVHTVGFVFQHFNLFPHLTVLENCSAPLLLSGTLSREKAVEQALLQLTLVGMESYAHRYPHQLSGGQQQRVAIARALALKPSLLLFDEPTSALDPESTEHFASVLKQLLQQGITIAYASHDMQFITATRDRVYLMEQGKIVDLQEGLSF